MKKIALIIVLFAFVVIANAQMNPESQKDPKKNAKMVQNPTETPISESDLLQSIKDDIKSKFTGGAIDNAWKIDSKGVVKYKVMVKVDNEEWSLIYDKDGNFVKKTAVKKMGMKDNKKEENPPEKY